jgi:peptidoglycan-associated lipoprotein
MKLSKIAKVVLLGCTILALGACSSKHKNSGYDATGMNDMNTAGGAQASGAGRGQSYGDEGSNGAARGLAKRTYYFDFNSYVVRDEDKPAILANADYLVAHPRAKIILEGHTDPRGSREYNVALGEHRAAAVLEMMKERGVNPNQVRIVSYGAERLATPGHSEQDFQLDRRVVIVKS